MADNGALQLLRPFLLRPSIFPSFHVWRFRNPGLFPSGSHLLYFSTSRLASVKITPLNRRRFSYIIGAVTEEGGRTERRKRERKRRELWEELFDDNVEDDDEFVGASDARGKSDLWKILEEIVDNVWILKAFRSYGYLLPFIILSLFFSTGPKAFLISLAVAIGPSLLFLAFKKLTGWDKRRRASIANQFGIDEEKEYEVERRRSRIRYSPSQVRNNVNGREFNPEMASKFGGWDELDRLGNIREQPRSEPERKAMRKRKRIRREKSAEPLLLRMLVSLTNMLKM